VPLERPGHVREREAALVQARASRAAAPRATARPRERPARRRSQSRWLPSEALLGIFLLLFGLTVAALLLTGAVKLGFAP
jgi:hypothetical protein